MPPRSPEMTMASAVLELDTNRPLTRPKPRKRKQGEYQDKENTKPERNLPLASLYQMLPEEVLGRGASSVVVVGVHKNGGTRHAIKVNSSQKRCLQQFMIKQRRRKGLACGRSSPCMSVLLNTQRN